MKYALGLTFFITKLVPRKEEEKKLGVKAQEMMYQFKLSIYQIRAGFLFALAIAMLFLGWGGIITVIITAGTIDPRNPSSNAWPQLASVSSYLLGLAIVGIAILIQAIVYFVAVGRQLKKEAESFKE